LEIVYLFYMILVVIMLMIYCDGMNLFIKFKIYFNLHIYVNSKGMGGGTAGLILNTTMGLMYTIQYAVRNAADLENQMTSVERILEYSELESEESPKEADSRLNVSPDWPLEGSIHFQDVCLTYENSTNETLIEINCEIKGGERVGIVGRTGAGKSSLLAVLFRMHRFKGRVTIDGTDITTIPLHELRRNISIIPQESIAFMGSVRTNLDPFSEHSDDRLWEVLEEVQLKDAVMEMPGRLDYELSESGSNLSAGQRQLICLSRAILRRSRILVLDEATANVDHRTDSLIQTAIRHHFQTSTLLTIAHRLNTIIDCHRVMVLDSGRIQEFDRPYLLLQNTNGMFYKLVQQTGHEMSTHLMSLAKQAFHETQEVTQHNAK
jgi:ATP-binding cassette subfamily C (CFTR/MRP) protein 4